MIIETEKKTGIGAACVSETIEKLKCLVSEKREEEEKKMSDAWWHEQMNNKCSVRSVRSELRW